MGQYGRIGKRRSGSGTWQWMVLGFFPGILCGGVVVFAMFASGALNSLTTASVPTQTPVVIIATNPPTSTSAATATVPTVETVATATSEPTVAGTVGVIDNASVQFPTSTPLSMATETTPQAGVTLLAQSTSIGPSSPEDVELTVVSSSNLQPNVQAVNQSEPTVSPELSALISGASGTSLIPGGTFTMGTTLQEVGLAVDECIDRDGGNCEISFGEDSLPQFQVQLDPYRMEQTEVSFRQYLAFLTYLMSQGKTHKDACPSPNGASNLCIQTTNELPGTAGQVGSGAPFTFAAANYNIDAGLLPYPVYGVTWAGAQAYCEAIGRRLPTEAEWEYAAKGNDPGRIYPWSNTWSELNAKTSRPRDLPPGTVAIGTYALTGTTPTGLQDMAGNVEEWVSDWYSESYYTDMSNQTQPVVNPTGPQNGLQKVLRGGSWDTLPFFARTVHRRSEYPAPDGNDSAFPRTIGFRCADDVEDDVPVSDGNTDPSELGVVIPTATVAASSAPEGTAMPGTGKRS